jgi:hypothetical protein
VTIQVNPTSTFLATDYILTIKSNFESHFIVDRVTCTDVIVVNGGFFGIVVINAVSHSIGNL